MNYVVLIVPTDYSSESVESLVTSNPSSCNPFIHYYLNEHNIATPYMAHT